jgi:hypothetical protein
MSEAMDRRALLAALTGAGVGLAAAPAAALDNDKQLKDLEKVADDLSDSAEELLEIINAWELPPKGSEEDYGVVLKEMAASAATISAVIAKLLAKPPKK